MSVQFFVPGFPQSQAGMKPIQVAGFTRLVSSGSKHFERWRRTVTAAVERLVLAHRDIQCYGSNGTPIGIGLTFYSPMPVSRPAGVRRLGIAPCTVKPDVDKLVRAVLDSLTEAKLIEDDARIITLTTSHWEVADHSLCGVKIAVEQLAIDTERMERVLAQRQDIAARIAPLDVLTWER